MKCLKTCRMEWNEDGLQRSWARWNCESFKEFQDVTGHNEDEKRSTHVWEPNVSIEYVLMIYIFGPKVIRSNNIIIKFMTCGCEIRKLSFDLWINMRHGTWNIEVLFHVICFENLYRKRYIVYKRPMKNYYVFIIYFRNKQVTNLIVILCIYDVHLCFWLQSVQWPRL